MNQPVLEMRGINKTFGNVVANHNVNIKLYAGEIHALLGENGAGKSTLMNILTGIYKPNSGQILYKGKEVVLKSSKNAVDLGIGMVHQHFALVQTLSVAENIYLHSEKCKTILNSREMENDIEKCSKAFNLALDAKAKIWQLSVGEQQRVEIVKLLYRGTEVLILDEPTAVLTPQESVEMFKTLRKMADSGKVIAFISHKMGEVMANSDRITVLRGGTVEDTMLAEDATEERLTKAVVGSANKLMKQSQENRGAHGACILKVQDLSVKNDKGLLAVKNISLDLYAGEIFGIAGVAGNGQREFSEVLAGLREVESGAVLLKGEDVSRMSPKTRIKKGFAFIPEDRLSMGLVPSMNMMDNTILKEYDTEPYSRKGILNHKAIQKNTVNFISRYDIKNGGLDLPVGLMSGGNQQKLLIAREINGEPLLIIAAYPVRGLDIGATEAIHKILMEQRNRGACILLISEELDEIFEMADRIAVMNIGFMSEVLNRNVTTYEEVGSLMIGMDNNSKT
jgi:general nucleoside transport system ATP-binding protein